MPSPFPGMDPYLEGPHWSSLHVHFCVEMARQLRPKLGSGYLALVEERVATESLTDIEIAARGIRPDVFVAARKAAVAGREGPSPMVMEPPVRLAVPMQEEVRTHFVEIRRIESLELVTTIELLSASNKQGKGRDEYLAKREEILHSSVNLIEIDLLRRGERLPMLQPYPPADFFAIVHRVAIRPWADVWPIGLRDRLPTIPVPLRPPDSDIQLELQSAFTEVYDASYRGDLTDYSRPLQPPVSPEDEEWIRKILSGRP